MDVEPRSRLRRGLAAIAVPILAAALPAAVLVPTAQAGTQAGTGSGAAAPATASASGPERGAGHVGAVGSLRLTLGLLRDVDAVGFDDVLDFGPVEGACPGADWCPVPAPRVANTPNVDVAVIELDRRGRPVRAANVLLSRDFPRGFAVPLDRNLAATHVRFREWDIDRWNGGTFSADDGSRLTTTGWRDDPPLTADDDIAPPRGRARADFMSPYPASLFKVLVAFHTLRMADAGIGELDDPYAYRPTGGGCPGGTTAGDRTVREWLDAMITYSSNQATCALVKQIHDLDQMDDLNSGLAALGLETLQVNGTSPTSGGNWTPGLIHMTAMDTARLLLVVAGGPGTLWRAPDGTRVTADVLSPASRELFRGLLAEQGFHEVLSTTNWCGLDHPAPGIPASVAERWVDPVTGTVTVEGIPYGQDVRPCNETAEVTFAHKTGLTYNYGSDAGIVRSRPGERHRHYVVAVVSNLGYRYADERFADAATLPCFDPGVCYTARFARLGALVDDRLARR
jgi:hypothetical protein